jgi:hypothetical protein
MAEVVEGIPHDKVPLERPRGIESRMVEYKAGDTMRSAVLYYKAGT